MQAHGPRSARIEIDEPIMLSGEQRRIDERLQVRLGEARGVARRLRAVERRAETPAGRQL
jgi:hypothetical protein